VLFEGNNGPAPMSKVAVRKITGGPIVTTFTDSSGAFQASGLPAGSYVLEVQAPNCAPVEQVVQETVGLSNVTVFVRRSGLHAEKPLSNTVSVRELSVPAKAHQEFEKGIERLAKSDPVSSIEYFEKATSKFPRYYEAYYWIGMAKLRLKRDDEAEQALQKSIDVSGGHYAPPHFALAALFAEKNNFADSERVVRRGLEVDANSWEGHLFLGQALFRLERIEEAEKSTHEALLRKPDLVPAYILLANIHLRKREYPSVLKDLDAYLRLDPNGPLAERARQIRDQTQHSLARSEREIRPPMMAY
jgi:hypothetical protein